MKFTSKPSVTPPNSFPLFTIIYPAQIHRIYSNLLKKKPAPNKPKNPTDQLLYFSLEKDEVVCAIQIVFICQEQ